MSSGAGPTTFPNHAGDASSVQLRYSIYNLAGNTLVDGRYQSTEKAWQKLCAVANETPFQAPYETRDGGPIYAQLYGSPKST